jgi:hypothetical protein
MRLASLKRKSRCGRSSGRRRRGNPDATPFCAELPVILGFWHIKVTIRGLSTRTTRTLSRGERHRRKQGNSSRICWRISSWGALWNKQLGNKLLGHSHAVSTPRSSSSSFSAVGVNGQLNLQEGHPSAFPPRLGKQPQAWGPVSRSPGKPARAGPMRGIKSLAPLPRARASLRPPHTHLAPQFAIVFKVQTRDCDNRRRNIALNISCYYYLQSVLLT